MRDYTKIQAWQKADDLRPLQNPDFRRVRSRGLQHSHIETAAVVGRVTRLGDFCSLNSSLAQLAPQAEETARTLTGLIHAVEKEAGPLTRTAARLSSFIILGLGWSVVYSLWSAV